MDFYGDPVSDAQISLIADVGTITAQATTDSEGEAIVTYTADNTPGWATVSASAGAVTDTVQVEITELPRVYLPVVVRNP